MRKSLATPCVQLDSHWRWIWFPQSRKFYVRADVNLTGYSYVNNKWCLNGLRRPKTLSAVQVFMLVQAAHTSSLIRLKLRPYAHKIYPTMEIHLETELFQWLCKASHWHNLHSMKLILFSVANFSSSSYHNIGVTRQTPELDTFTSSNASVVPKHLGLFLCQYLIPCCCFSEPLPFRQNKKIKKPRALITLIPFIIWQSSVKVNPHVLIGPFLVGILPYGPFPWKRS